MLDCSYDTLMMSIEVAHNQTVFVIYPFGYGRDV